MKQTIQLSAAIIALGTFLISCNGDGPGFQLIDAGGFTFNGGGEEMPNQAFVDLSTYEQVTVDKLSWDLGFYSKAGEHAVVVNNSAYVMARSIDKNDLNAVVANDTLGFAAKMVVSNYSDTEASGWIDDQSGNLDATAFGAISSTNANNNVFIIRRVGAGRNWKKVRVLQDGDNYTLQYADIAATSFSTLSITKDADYNFQFVDLDNGLVDVEPARDRWDMMYGTYANRANFGSILAIGYKDYIVTNRNNVEVAVVFTEDFEYDEITLADVDDLTFSSSISAIGSGWRSGGGPNGGPELYTDRFYVLKDTEGNVYKVLFTALYTLSGERGYPEFIYELIEN